MSGGVGGSRCAIAVTRPDPPETYDAGSRGSASLPAQVRIASFFACDAGSKWMPEIERFAHESGNYLIIVGAGHLVGDDGVVAQLKRAGYSVQQL